jgi:hypothetical protein
MLSTAAGQVFTDGSQGLGHNNGLKSVKQYSMQAKNIALSDTLCLSGLAQLMHEPRNAGKNIGSNRSGD